jgi:hypothetical protein
VTGLPWSPPVKGANVKSQMRYSWGEKHNTFFFFCMECPLLCWEPQSWKEGSQAKRGVQIKSNIERTWAKRIEWGRCEKTLKREHTVQGRIMGMR